MKRINLVSTQAVTMLEHFFLNRPASVRGSQMPRHVQSSRVHLTVEPLEARNLLDGGLANVLVNDPTADYPWLGTVPWIGTQQSIPADTQSETAVALAGNRIVVAYNDTNHFRTREWQPPTEELHNTGYAISKDGGKTFQDMGSLPDEAIHHDLADPVLAFSSKTGTTFLVTTSGNTIIRNVGEQINVYRSLDRGDSFLSAVDGTPGFTAGVDLQDKPWVAVDNFPGPDGSGYGNAYLAWTDFSFENGKTGLYFTRSTNDGLTWGPGGGTLIARGKNQDDTAGPIDAFVTVGKDHAVYMFWLDYYGLSMQMRKSTDQGVTFGDPVTVAKVQKHSHSADLGLTDNLGRNIRADSAPYVVVNPSNGDLYLVYADKPDSAKDHADIFFVQSSDGGQSWSLPRRVNDDRSINDQWDPALAVTPDGTHVGVFWYDRRLDTANNLIDHYGVIGTVSGHSVNFAPNFRITDVSFPPVVAQDVTVNPAYMGDYDQAVADNNYFYTTWGDNRLPNPNYAADINQPDVRFAKIPVTYAGGTAALAAATSLGGSTIARTTHPLGSSALATDRSAVEGGFGAMPALVAPGEFAVPTSAAAFPLTLMTGAGLPAQSRVSVFPDTADEIVPTLSDEDAVHPDRRRATTSWDPMRDAWLDFLWAEDISLDGRLAPGRKTG